MTNNHRLSSSSSYRYQISEPDTLNNRDPEFPRVPRRWQPGLLSLHLGDDAALDVGQESGQRSAWWIPDHARALRQGARGVAIRRHPCGGSGRVSAGHQRRGHHERHAQSDAELAQRAVLRDRRHADLAEGSPYCELRWIMGAGQSVEPESDDGADDQLRAGVERPRARHVHASELPGAVDRQPDRRAEPLCGADGTRELDGRQRASRRGRHRATSTSARRPAHSRAAVRSVRAGRMAAAARTSP